MGHFWQNDQEDTNPEKLKLRWVGYRMYFRHSFSLMTHFAAEMIGYLKCGIFMA